MDVLSLIDSYGIPIVCIAGLVLTLKFLWRYFNAKLDKAEKTHAKEIKEYKDEVKDLHNKREQDTKEFAMIVSSLLEAFKNTGGSS